MKKSFYRKYNGAWFRDKEGIALCDIQNNGGGIVKKGEKFLFRDKSGSGGYRIRSLQGVAVVGVSPGSVDLV